MGLLAAGKKGREKKKGAVGGKSIACLKCEEHLFSFGEFPLHPGFLILK